MLDPQPQVVDAYERPGNRPDHCRRPPAYQVPEAKGQCREPERQKAASMTHVALRDGRLHQALALSHSAQQFRCHRAECDAVAACEEAVLRVRDLRGLGQEELYHADWGTARLGHEHNLLLRQELLQRGKLPVGRLRVVAPAAHHLPAGVLGQAHGEGRQEPCDVAHAPEPKMLCEGTGLRQGFAAAGYHRLPHSAALPIPVICCVRPEYQQQPQGRAH
mmetsp:Transcript_67847/g.188124  ORF Transcript_67847/g.188124 Transcript_67847/m.188124 type:complete len:219 (-) Transcript_67847:533-1189(-)